MKTMTWCRTRFCQARDRAQGQARGQARGQAQGQGRAAGYRLSFLALMVLAVAVAAPASAATIETAAREAILIDAATGAVLFEKDADLSMPIQELDRFLPPHSAGADIVIGSREAV